MVSAALDHRIRDFVAKHRLEIQDDLDGMVGGDDWNKIEDRTLFGRSPSSGSAIL
jgi:hypothetical protein